MKTFAKIDPATMVPYKVDTEDFGSILLKFGKAKHGFVNGAHANASISQVAAGWKCDLYLGIYGTKDTLIASGLIWPEAQDILDGMITRIADWRRQASSTPAGKPPRAPSLPWFSASPQVPWPP